jgi:hypothetical protein
MKGGRKLNRGKERKEKKDRERINERGKEMER